MTSRRELANAIRALSMDAVQKANSGHPGMPMGMADIAEVLWNDFLRHNPENPQWINRDRFVISNGHGSMLLYALLHLAGYPSMSLDEIKNFRQLHSKTPGHPEYGLAPGIETTTGPLGQGIANGVGMALAERTLAAQFNRPDHAVIDHFTYVFLGDGCLMEGISHESCSLAGHLGLGKLIAFWDDNGISIDGHTAGWFTDDTPMRFESYGWHVIRDVDGHHSESIFNAIKKAQETKNKPTLICCKTVIGFGSPNLAGSEKAHGAALGEREVSLAREQLGWQHPPFEIPEAIYERWNARDRGKAYEKEWNQVWVAYQQNYPECARDLQRRLSKQLPKAWGKTAEDFILSCQQEQKDMATRKASQQCLDAYGPLLPELLGGSADLTGSNNTRWSDCVAITHRETNGNYLYYGVREFGMAAIMNGLALHGGFIPYGGTFLVFSDYARNALRLSAMAKQQVIYVLTHDSIGLGEDGPTHQPIEHLASLRNTPGFVSWRPCDSVETAVAWQKAIERVDGPTALILTRQSVPHQERNAIQLKNIERGGYVLRDCHGEPEIIIIATGSEVQIAVEAYQRLADKKIRVVSMPSTDLFETQEQSYREEVLPTTVRKRIAVEALASNYWYKYVGLDGKVMGLDRFGESAPATALFSYFGFTTENLISLVNELCHVF